MIHIHTKDENNSIDPKKTHLSKKDLLKQKVQTWSQYNRANFALPLSKGAIEYLNAH